jgi:hypothetical protein
MQNLLSSIRAAQNLEAVRFLLQKTSMEPACSEIGNDFYFLKGFFFQLGLQLYSSVTSDCLRLVNKIGINSGPKFHEEIILPSGESVIVTSVEGCELLPPTRFDGPRRLSQDAVSHLRRDLDLLLAAGLLHPACVKGYSVWMLAPGTERIFFLGWEMLRHLVDDEKITERERFENLLKPCIDPLAG